MSSSRKNTRRAQGDSSKGRHIRDLEEMVANNAAAVSTVISKKSWSIHDMLHVQPMTVNQKTMFHHWDEGQNIAAHGWPGTGKTFLALVMAMEAVLANDTPQDRVIIVRSVVPTREIGFLPGSVGDKVAEYEAPYEAIMQELFGRASTYADMKAAGLIEFKPTSFIRGVTWDDAIVVVDEVQNLSFHEINSVVTRVGENTRVIFAGDLTQGDLNGRQGNESGFPKLMRTLQGISEFSAVEFGVDDIVRSELVKKWIIASAKADEF